MLKRIFSILLVAIIAIFCVSCNKESVDNNADNSVDDSSSLSALKDESVYTDDAQSQENDLQNITYDAMLIPNFEAICQYPDLPTGCEMTSLTMVLNYYGLNADKCDISDNYLDKGEVGSVDFRKAFVGDPRDENSFGCYAPVVVNAANRYLESQGSKLKATDVTGRELESLYEYINIQVPVIIWGTLDCKEGYYSVTWNVDGQDLTWITPEHCMVMVGYDQEAVWIADPIYGEVVSYDREIFESCYNLLFKQAVVIE
ncbi:MAG: hypothetical protein E7513_03365 [Ruminococcaceae bacterium]|nr:hypothetical protein [Oscillospiraceae bacterium]